MVEWNIIMKLMNCFPGSVINQNGEFIAHIKTNQYFILHSCETELDVKCKALEWLSRAAHKGQPYRAEKRNKEYRKFMLDGINKFLDTDFSEDDIEQIYTYLGNACNHNKTIQFIESNYDMQFLIQRKKGD